MGKFDFDEMDSAMQNAESKRQYEQQTELLNKNIELGQELNENLGLYIEQVQNLIKVIRAIIFDIDKASTIKCPSNLKPLLYNYANEVCIDVIKKMNTEASSIIKRIVSASNRKTISESLFYVLMISAVSFLAFFITVCCLNYVSFHLAELWAVVVLFGIITVFTIAVALYLTRK